METPNLINLTITHNKLSEIENNLCETAKKLQTLDLSHNSLTLNEQTDKYENKDLINCTQLDELNLSYNNISKYPYWTRDGNESTLPESRKKNLHLEYNNIYEISVGKIIKNYCNLCKHYMTKFTVSEKYSGQSF